jgi:simple sugar transport system permease protein
VAERRRTTGLLATEGVPVAIVLLAIIAVFMITAPNSFQSPRIYLSFLATVPPPLIVGLGLTLVIAAGEIDLSFPSVIKMSGVVFAMLCKFVAFPLDPQAAGGLAPDLLIWLFAFLAILVGAAIGFFNGVLVAVIGIPSIIATLCSLFIFEGLSLIVGNGLQFSIRGIDSYSLFHVLSGRWFGIPAQAVWGLALTVAIWLLLNRHRFGEHLLFIGDNQDVARVLGVNVRREKLKLFTLMGALAGLASILVTLENRNFYTTQGSSYLLIVMAAVFIGGTSISGGKGSIVGTLFGCYIVGCMEAGVVASGLSGFWTRLVVGLVFLAAVIFHLAMERPGMLAGLVGLRLGGRLAVRQRSTPDPAIAAGSQSGRES